MERAQLKTEDFDYPLPDHRIAKYPLENRNASKLLLYKDGVISQDVFSELGKYLPKNSTLVFNDTRVLAARLRFTKDTGAHIEVFCLEPYQQLVEEALVATESCTWSCMVGNLKKMGNATVSAQIAGTTLHAHVAERRSNDVLVTFTWDSNQSFASILEKAGEVPLPPYLNREAEAEDKDNYQTVYAKNEGAVAAPTAGLHFIPEQKEALKEAGHRLSYLTLYVGAGTFRPVKASNLVDHEMHRERIVIHRDTVKALSQTQGAVISVGTTSLRSLESLYWLAVKMQQEKDESLRELGQEDAYQLPNSFSWQEACQYILEVMDREGLETIDFYSSLYIMPGYKWKAIDGLITNFHQPKSTLLALIAAWIGQDWKQVYEYALEHDFRFLSYGDSSLLLRNKHVD